MTTDTAGAAPGTGHGSSHDCQAVDDLGQTTVIVTHDPVAAGYSNRVVFLADGRVVDHMPAPTAAAVLDSIKALGP